MLAKIVTDFGCQEATDIISKFFEVYDGFDWASSLQLDSPDTIVDNSRYGWPESVYSNEKKMFQILTSTFPIASTTENITIEAIQKMKYEMKRGHKMSKEISNGSATWRDLNDANIA